MKKALSKIYCLALSIAVILSGCSSHVPLDLETVAAEQAVTKAYRSGAHLTAENEYEAAREALAEGKTLAEKGEPEEARAVLLEAMIKGHEAIIKGHEAELATYRQQLETTEKQLDSAEEYILRLEAQRNIYFEALSNIYDEQKMSEIEVEDSKQDYKPAQPAMTYRVRRGENLFAIAARRNVYGDALLWPLIYKANRDQIKNPQQIYPGQLLTIPRDVSEKEKEEARATARESKIFQEPAPDQNGK